MTASSKTVVRWAVIVSIVWLLLFISVGLWWTGQPPAQSFHPRNMGLNELGDFIAGATAPLGAMWLVVTVYLQAVGLARSRSEFIEAQQSTAKLALFEKRFVVLQKLKQGAASLHWDKGAQAVGRRTLSEAAESAEFLLGVDVRGMLKEIIDRAKRLAHYDMTYDRLYMRKGASDAEKELLEQAIEGRHADSMWLIENATDAKLNELFRPYLEMPMPSLEAGR